MNLTDLLARMGGLQSIAREVGVSEREAATGAEALLPAILGGFKKQAQTQPEGLEGLGDLLNQLGGGGLADQVLAPQPTDVNQGNSVLNEIFGSKDVSRAVAETASSRTGLEPWVLKRMLPLLAMLVTGLMAKHHSGTASPGGGLGDILGGMLGGRAQQPGAQGQTASRTGGLGGLGGLGAMLDLNGDGNALDDILRLAGRALR